MTLKTCADCGAPIGDDMLPTSHHGCWWHGQYIEAMRQDGRSEEDIEAFKKSGADAPCYGHHYDQWIRKRDRKDVALMIGIPLTVIALIAFVGWLFG